MRWDFRFFNNRIATTQCSKPFLAYCLFHRFSSMLLLVKKYVIALNKKLNEYKLLYANYKQIYLIRIIGYCVKEKEWLNNATYNRMLEAIVHDKTPKTDSNFNKYLTQILISDVWWTTAIYLNILLVCHYQSTPKTCIWAIMLSSLQTLFSDGRRSMCCVHLVCLWKRHILFTHIRLLWNVVVYCLSLTTNSRKLTDSSE